MRRSLTLMQLLHQHQQYNPSGMTKKWVSMNVITLVSPTPMMSKQMIHELQRWTQPLSQKVDCITTSDISDAGSSAVTATAPKQLGSCFHYSNDTNDALDDLVQTKQMNQTKNGYYSMVPSFYQNSSLYDSNVTDSVILCVGEDTSDTPMASNELSERTNIPTTFLHIVSSSPQSNSIFSFNNNKNMNGNIALFAIQSMPVSIDIVCGQKQTFVQEIRNRLAQLLIEKENEHRLRTENMRLSLSWMESMKLSMRQFIRQQQYRRKAETNSCFSSMLRSNDFLPFFDVTTTTPNEKKDTCCKAALPKWHIGDLKEIVIPFDFSSTTYQNNQSTTFMDILSSTYHHQHRRPVTGLYQLPHSNVYIRPIPMAKEDRQCCTSPTLIFHSDTEYMDEAQKQHNAADNNTSTTKLMKIGYSGRASYGQLMISDTNRFGGMHIRLCAQHQPTSMYAEAQDSLLASSLSELQSKDVLLSNTDSSTSTDPRTNNTDCWVEFRANLRHPLGFISSSLLSSNAPSNPPKIAKAPNIPYE